MWQLNVAVAHVQGRFRDTYPCSLPDIPGATESSHRAALVGDTIIRTAGIVEPSVSQKVDGGPEEGHGHGIYVIIVLIDSCLCDIISTDFDAKLMQFRVVLLFTELNTLSGISDKTGGEQASLG